MLVAANSRLFKTIAQQWVEVRPPRRESTKKRPTVLAFPKQEVPLTGGGFRGWVTQQMAATIGSTPL